MTIIADEVMAEPTTFRWTHARYERAAEGGLFHNRRVQLIDGEVYEMAPQRDRHAFCVRLVDAALRRVFPGDRFTVLAQLPMRLGDDSEPEPDVAVIHGSVRENPAHPTTALLVVEVADTTLAFDRKSKLPIYAKADVREYWIVNLIDRCVEVFRRPARAADGRWSYEDVRQVVAGETIAPAAAPESKIAVADLLP